jgi:murein L,D-transpeptidase YcbB/YkuD
LYETRAVVGTPYTKTPVFSGMMRYIELSPTWTVPRGIVREVLAHVQRNRSYLAVQGMRVFTHAGAAVDPSGIAFDRYSAATFPYVFRQDPGPLNPLGGIKFVFPNGYNVYLHDTPQRELFARGQRTFSHGCIRIENPLALAELLLDEPDVWNVSTLDSEIAKGETRTLMLGEPIPVLILYWTAVADRHGELHFYPDVYGRDAPLLRALNRS